MCLGEQPNKQGNGIWQDTMFWQISCLAFDQPFILDLNINHLKTNSTHKEACNLLKVVWIDFSSGVFRTVVSPNIIVIFSYGALRPENFYSSATNTIVNAKQSRPNWNLWIHSCVCDEIVNGSRFATNRRKFTKQLWFWIDSQLCHKQKCKYFTNSNEANCDFFEKIPKENSHCFEEISSSKGAPGILLDLQRFKFLNILCVWLECSEQQAHYFMQNDRVQTKFWKQ